MTFDEFKALIERTAAIRRRPNAQQEDCLLAPPGTPTMIVAGPGSGKTTVLVLRALRHILVDHFEPEQIVITTFTVKAAREIRSRLIEWGEGLLETATAGALAEEERNFLRTVDINRVITGTLDSICQEALGSDRHADEPPLVTLESFAAGVTLQRRGRLNATYLANRPVLDAFLANYTFDGGAPRTVADAASAMIPIIERFVQDRVDVDGFAAPDQPEAQQLIGEISRTYRDYLQTNNLLDFSSLEESLLMRLRAARVPTLLAGVKAVLVDEYQDTNALQEAIYFELVDATDAAFTVVGDDDQSLYRFRGATIELFRAFIERCRARLGRAPTTPLYLTENYRSSDEIVSFFNTFIRNDPNFGPARIQPPKPVIRSHDGLSGMPILGMFREDRENLADSLADFLQAVFRTGGYSDPAGRFNEPLRAATEGGDLGDAVMLGFSVTEIQRPYYQQDPKPRFTHFLREALIDRGMAMFNPRGRSLRDIPEVQRLLGLVLLTIDPGDRPGGPLFEGMSITDVAKFFMRRWIGEARAFLAGGPARIYDRSLRQEMKDWSDYVLGIQTTGQSSKWSSRDWPFLDVIYGLVPWISYFENDPEGQVYLEAISRAAGQASGFSAYAAKLIRPLNANAEDDHGRRSVQAIIRDVIAPIAENAIDVDEEIMPEVPRDRLNVMTIHQAKGLEYPLVIVDVGADFTTNAVQNRFRRFPEEPSATAEIENLLAPFTPELGALRTARSALDRSFEDLIRLYYVAFSRPQSVLLLIGCDKALRYNASIKNVALGWRQDLSWAWREATPPSGGRRPPAMVLPPQIQLL